MLRLFVGIMLPPEQRLALSIVSAGLHGARWVDPGNLHVTLRFIGEVDEGQAADIDLALARIKAPRFPLGIAGMGVFGADERPHLLYAGLDRSEPLLRLHDRVEGALMRLQLPPEPRRYMPHVTLASLRQPRPEEVRRFVAENNLLRLPPFEVDRFELIASYLTKSGSIYEDVAAYKLL
jgi:2'-5' RNA ligase